MIYFIPYKLLFFKKNGLSESTTTHPKLQQHANNYQAFKIGMLYEFTSFESSNGVNQRLDEADQGHNINLHSSP